MKPNPYNQPDPSSFPPLATVDRDGARLRLNPGSWPPYADPAIHVDLSENFAAANQALDDFDAFAKGVDADANLSPAGKHAKKQDWAKQMVPAMQARLDKLTKVDVPNLQNDLDGRIKGYLGDRSAAPSDPNDVALCVEIRSMLRAMPDGSQWMKVRAMIEAGDRTVIQAIQNAPGYLSGLSDDDLGHVQTAVLVAVEASDPDGFAEWEARRDALLAVRRGLDGVVRCVASETGYLKQFRDEQQVRETRARADDLVGDSEKKKDPNRHLEVWEVMEELEEFDRKFGHIYKPPVDKKAEAAAASAKARSDAEWKANFDKTWADAFPEIDFSKFNGQAA